MTESEKLTLKAQTIRCIPDENLRNCIFSGLEVSEHVIMNDMLSHMGNMMLMAFWGYFLIWRERPYEGSDAIPTTTQRINNAFRNIYSNGSLTLETIAYILTEIQLDAKHVNSVFFNLIKSDVKNSVFQTVAEMVRIWRMRYKRAEQERSKLTQYYLDLLSQLHILKGISVIEKDEKLFMTVKVPDGYDVKYYPSDPEYPADFSLFIRRIENNSTYEEDYYFLHKAEYKNKRIHLKYLSFDGNRAYSDTSDDCLMSVRHFNEMSGAHMGSKYEGDLIKSLNVHDFKYIHRLAVAVTDSIGKKTKEYLLANFSQKGDSFPKSLQRLSLDELNWDNIIVLYMLEEGPSELLEFILKYDPEVMDRILERLPIRFQLNESAADLKKKFAEIENREKRYQEKILGVSGIKETLQDWDHNARISLGAQFIISTIASTDEDAGDEGITTNAFYAESLSMKERRIRTVLARNNSIETISVINKTLERLFRMLILFYSGMLAYAEKQQRICEEVLNKEALHKKNFLNELQHNCEEAFFDEVEKMISGDQCWENSRTPVMRASLGELIRQFRELCEKMENHTESVTEFQPNGLLLYSLIGRRQICSLDTLNDILTSNAEDFDGIEDYPKDMADFINAVLKHDKKDYHDIDSITEIYLRYVIELFEFLTFNVDYKAEAKKQVQSVFDPIFPYVVRYSEKSENRDKCSVCRYVINVDGGYDKMQGVKLLTEYEYQINELYYCIPNAECSTRNWWVSPFLISCRRFDKLLLKIEE